MEQVLEACWTFLLQQSIKTTKDWLEACIEWLVEENNNILSDTTKLKDLVYEQWLMADLGEIAAASLPSLRSNTESQTFNGKFCVQVNNIMDIGHPAYSQFLKIKGEEIDEVDDDQDEDEANVKEFFKKADTGNKKKELNSQWKEKSSRMLFLTLYDGVQSANAIEYQPINHISVDAIMPGGKVMLIGPLLCRDSMFLLRPENIKILGGNVEHLVESASQVKLLKSALKIEDKEDNADSDQIIMQQQQSQLMQQQQQPQQQQQKNLIQQQQRQHQHRLQQNIDQSTSHSNMHLKKPALQNSSINQTKHSHNKNSSNTVTLTKSNKKNYTSAESNLVDIDDDIFDTEIFENIPIDDWDVDIDSGITSIRTDSTKRRTSVRSDGSSILKTTSVANSVARKTSDRKLATGAFSSSTSVASSGKKINGKHDKNIIEMDLNDDFFNADDDDNYSRACDVSRPTNHRNDFISTSKRDEVNQIVKKGGAYSNRNLKRGDNYNDHYNNVPIAKQTEECVIPEPDFNNFFDSPNENDLQCVPDVNPISVIQEIPLSEMISATPPLSKTFAVKGWFQTLKSKLEFDQHYKLLAVLTDGKYYAMVLLGDKALTELVGYPAKQVNQAVTGQLSQERKKVVKVALCTAEKALATSKWIMQLKYDQYENIYKIIHMKSTGPVD